MMTFGAFICKHREARGWTRLRLAQEAKVDPTEITHVERGRYWKRGREYASYTPGRRITMCLAHALGANVHEALLLAGFAPDVPVAVLETALEHVYANRLEPELRQALPIDELCSWMPRYQHQLSLFINHAIAGVSQREAS